jgi:hypothetical protein
MIMDVKNYGSKLRDAVVQISCNGHGNGFLLLKRDYYIICPADLVYPNEGKILATIPNVNGCGKSISYMIKIVGADIDGNIAIMKIDYFHKWNLNNPKLINHIHLNFYKSRNLIPGDQVLLIGNIINDTCYSDNVLLMSSITNNKYSSNDNSVKGELLLLGTTSFGSCHGMAVISSNGKIVGLQIRNDSTLMVAISEFFMRRIIKAIANFDSQDKYCNFIKNIDNCRFYKKSFLGIKATVTNQSDLDIDDENEGTEGTEYKIKEVIGYIIKDFDQNSPLKGILNYGDIITHINERPLGIRKGQLCITNILWKLLPEDNIKISYMNKDQNYNFINNCYINTTFYDEISKDYI